MEDVWTEAELIEAYPLGSVFVQVDDDVEPMPEAEWETWIAGQVGMPKHPVGAVEG